MTTNKLANAASTAAKLGAGSVRAGKLGTISVRSHTEQIADGAGGDSTASCNPGERMLGGAYGGPAPNAAGWYVMGSEPVSELEWRVRVFNDTGSSDGVDARVLCLQGGG